MLSYYRINEWIFSKTKIFRANVKVELNWANYATKADLKTAAGVDTSGFDKMTDLAFFFFFVDKLDIEKLKKYQLI